MANLGSMQFVRGEDGGLLFQENTILMAYEGKYHTGPSEWWSLEGLRERIDALESEIKSGDVSLSDYFEGKTREIRAFQEAEQLLAAHLGPNYVRDNAASPPAVKKNDSEDVFAIRRIAAPSANAPATP